MDRIPCAKHLAIRSNSHDKKRGTQARIPTLSTSSGTGTQPSFSIYSLISLVSFLSLEPVQFFILSIKGRECNLDRPTWLKPTSQIQVNLLHRCIELSRPGHHKKILLNLSEVREGGKARYN